MREGTGNFQNGDLLYMATHPVADAIRIGRTKPYECSYPVMVKRPRIPVSERLPEESLNSVIGWDIYRNRCCFVQYLGGRFVLGDDIDSVNVTAWMPLPEPYRESEEEQ